MRNLKIGDKVKIRQDLVHEKIYNNCSYNADMEKYAGKVATITNIFRDSETEVNYSLDIDSEEWYWDSEMLMKVSYKVGDKVKIKDTLKVGNYGSNKVVEDMLMHLGKTTTIEEVHELARGTEYCLRIDGQFWNWTPEMLEPVEEVETKTYTEKDSTRLAKAVCEYEELVHKLEQEVKEYKQMYYAMLDKANDLIDEYNNLVDDFNELVDRHDNLI